MSNVSPTINPSASPFDRPITSKALREEWKIPYSDSHLARLEKAGEFPRRFKLAGRTIAWLESEISAWIVQRAATRNVAEVPHA
jgi:prophage regulatory protein